MHSETGQGKLLLLGGFETAVLKVNVKYLFLGRVLLTNNSVATSVNFVSHAIYAIEIYVILHRLNLKYHFDDWWGAAFCLMSR